MHAVSKLMLKLVWIEMGPKQGAWQANVPPDLNKTKGMARGMIMINVSRIGDSHFPVGPIKIMKTKSTGNAPVSRYIQFNTYPTPDGTK